MGASLRRLLLGHATRPRAFETTPPTGSTDPAKDSRFTSGIRRVRPSGWCQVHPHWHTGTGPAHALPETGVAGTIGRRWSSGPADRLWGAPTANLAVEGRRPEDPLQESFLGCPQRGPPPGASGP